MENNSGQNNQYQDNNNTDVNRNFGTVDSQHNANPTLHSANIGPSRPSDGASNAASAAPNNFRLSSRQVEILQGQVRLFKELSIRFARLNFVRRSNTEAAQVQSNSQQQGNIQQPLSATQNQSQQNLQQQMYVQQQLQQMNNQQRQQSMVAMQSSQQDISSNVNSSGAQNQSQQQQPQLQQHHQQQQQIPPQSQVNSNQTMYSNNGGSTMQYIQQSEQQYGQVNNIGMRSQSLPPSMPQNNFQTSYMPQQQVQYQQIPGQYNQQVASQYQQIPQYLGQQQAQYMQSQPQSFASQHPMYQQQMQQQQQQQKFLSQPPNGGSQSSQLSFAIAAAQSMYGGSSSNNSMPYYPTNVNSNIPPNTAMNSTIQRLPQQQTQPQQQQLTRRYAPTTTPAASNPFNAANAPSNIARAASTTGSSSGTGNVAGVSIKRLKAIPPAVAAVPSEPKASAVAATTDPTAAASTTRKPTGSWQSQGAILKIQPNINTSQANQSSTNVMALHNSSADAFMKSSYAPLVMTNAFVKSVREKMFCKLVGTSPVSTSNSSSNEGAQLDTASTQIAAVDAVQARMNQLLKLQREARGEVVKKYIKFASNPNAKPPRIPNSIHPIETIGADNYMQSDRYYLMPYKQYIRSKKQSVRDVKSFEKLDRRKKNEVDDKKKRRVNEFHKQLMVHRDEFMRFHKGKKADCTKMARLVKMWVENQDFKKEKDECRAEMRRLQALKENDMEAYNQLVQETKNSRLKFLLSQTDSYMNTINQLIQDQRISESATLLDSETSAYSAGIPNPATLIGDMSGEKITKASKEYYQSTHRTIETVSQPRMLKGGDLKEYQMGGLQWLVSLYNNNLNGILADEMGLGKTIQTIALITYLMEFKHNNGPFLIVVPLSTLSNWVNEFNKWAPDVLKVVYKGQPDERKRLFKEDVEDGHLNVLITTYEYTMRDKASLRKLTWQYIIVDEGHRMKNANSKFAQTLGTAYSSKHRILLTGTPLQNNLPELWALLNFLLPTIFSSVDTFDQWFNKPFAAFRAQGANAAAVAEEEGENAALTQEERLLIVHRLHEVLRPFMLRRVKFQVLDQLPEKVERVLKCNLSGWQRKMYQSITSKGLAIKDKEKESSGGLNNTIMQLRKVCNHPYLFLRDYVVDEDMIRSSGKFELLDRMLPKLKAAGHRVLLFSQMVEAMNFLEQFFLFRGFQYLRLDGNTSSDEREKRMHMFNDPNSPHFIFLLSTRAGGLGLNLATADTVIIFDSDWNPMMDAQAQDRAHRIGQKNEVRVFRLLTASPIEERILARATDKKNLTGLVVEAGKFSNQPRKDGGEKDADGGEDIEDKEMMASLLNVWSTGGGNAASLNLTGDGDNPNPSREDGDGNEESDLPDDEQINVMMASYEGELELYQSMDITREVQRKQRWQTLHSGVSPTSLPPLPSRLTAANEKPVWLNDDCWPKKYESIMKDMMNLEVQWQPTVQPVKISHGTVGRPPKLKPSQSMNDLEDGEVPDDDNDLPNLDIEEGDEAVMESVSTKKVLRKRKEAVRYDDGMSEIQYQKFVEQEEDNAINTALSAKKAKQMNSKAMISSDTSAASSIHKEVATVVSDIIKIRKADGMRLCHWFMEKPSRKILPQYYTIISQPISLKEITAKLKSGEYQYLENVDNDFALMSDNARTFNSQESPIFGDCEQIRREFFNRTMYIRKPYSSKYPSLEVYQSLPMRGYTIHSTCLMSLTEKLPYMEEMDNNGGKTKRSKSLKTSSISNNNAIEEKSLKLSFTISNSTSNKKKKRKNDSD